MGTEEALALFPFHPSTSPSPWLFLGPSFLFLSLPPFLPSLTHWHLARVGGEMGEKNTVISDQPSPNPMMGSPQKNPDDALSWGIFMRAREAPPVPDYGAVPDERESHPPQLPSHGTPQFLPTVVHPKAFCCRPLPRR